MGILRDGSPHASPATIKRGSLTDMKSKPTANAGWTTRQDLVVEIASPEVAAEKLGRTVESVLARRLEIRVA